MVSVDDMMSDIQGRVAVCRVAYNPHCETWAMAFVLNDAQIEALIPKSPAFDCHERGPDRREYEQWGTIFGEYPSLEACVRAEHARWVRP